MDKILIEIYYCYGNSGEITKKAESFIIDSIDELEEALDEVGYDEFIEPGCQEYDEFINGNISSIMIDNDGDWDDPVAYKLVRYFYEEKMKEIEETYKAQKDEINLLFND